MALKSNCETLEKIDEAEEMFVLRAQDVSASKTIAYWILENINTAPPRKLREALDTAIKMRNYPARKLAD